MPYTSSPVFVAHVVVSASSSGFVGRSTDPDSDFAIDAPNSLFSLF
jgi:hypothetical protein